ncbi:MAG: nitroreductase family protein [Baekduia sp.]
MDLDSAIYERRTHKVFGAERVPPNVVSELIELARWAPNHHVTNPWRFRVLGPQSVERLKAAEGDVVRAKKLDRAPTLIAVTCASAPGASEPERREDLMAAACAAYALLLGATARGLANYWRTPAVLERSEGRAALGIGENEQIVGLIHLGPLRQPAAVSERAPVEAIAEFLD